MYARHLVIAAATLALVSSSAIPMWEFLTRGEKMSHLFNMFVKQVADHCDSSNMPDCQKVLLVYGLTNLAKMEDDSLDKMDPYQRGANDIIWESMMHGSYKKKTEEHRDYYLDALEPSTSDSNQLGSQNEASSKVESYASGYVLGPMVVRVRPDGSPVPEEAPLPRDEDKEEFQAMRARPVPTLEQLSGKAAYSSIADILAGSNSHVEASTYRPHRSYTDLFTTHRSAKNFEVTELTPPPGYEHYPSLSEIEEQFAEEQRQKEEAEKKKKEQNKDTSAVIHSDKVLAKHVSGSVTSSRKTKV